MARYEGSGYIIALQSVVWTSGQSVNSLTDNEWTDLSDEILNSAGYVWGDFELVVGSAAYTSADSNFSLYIVRAINGTYQNWTGNVATEEPENENCWVDTQRTSGQTAAQRIVFPDIRLPPGQFKAAVRNQSGATTPASACTLGWRPHSMDIV